MSYSRSPSPTRSQTRSPTRSRTRSRTRSLTVDTIPLTHFTEMVRSLRKDIDIYANENKKLYTNNGMLKMRMGEHIDHLNSINEKNVHHINNLTAINERNMHHINHLSTINEKQSHHINHLQHDLVVIRRSFNVREPNTNRVKYDHYSNHYSN